MVWKAARPSFYLKKTAHQWPGNSRPISISSVLTRLLNKVFVQRNNGSIQLDEQQRTFRAEVNVYRDDIVFLDATLQFNGTHTRASRKVQPLIATNWTAGLPPELVDYLRGLYENSCTQLIGNGWQIAALRVTRGVKQGDLLLQVNFNILKYQPLSLPQMCDASFNNVTIR